MVRNLRNSGPLVCCEGCGSDTRNDNGFCHRCYPAIDRISPLTERIDPTFPLGAGIGVSRPRVYISGPITKGDWEGNFKQAAAMHHKLIGLGFAPLNPMLSMRLPDHDKIDHSVWIESDLPWVEVSDAVIRLPGESKGADLETDHAELCCVPVFQSVDLLVSHFQ